MRRIIQIILLWITRHLIWFVVIVAILALVNLIRTELAEFHALTNDREVLIRERPTIEKHFQDKKRDAENSIKQLENASGDKLASRAKAIEEEIKRKKYEQQKYEKPSPLSLLFSSTGVNGYLEYQKRDVEIKVLEKEGVHLKTLVGYTESRFQRDNSIKKLNDIRLVHVAAYSRLEQIALKFDSTDINELCKKSWDDGLRAAIRALWRPEYQELRVACDASVLADKNYKIQKTIADGFRNLKLNPFAIQPATANEALSQIDQEIAARGKKIQSHLAQKASGPVIKVIPTAALILLSFILAPIAIKAIFYFVIAPLATRRPPINLLPESSGKLDGEYSIPSSDFSQTKLSAVSFPVTVDDLHELLIQPDYLQSASIEGTKEMKWLMDWSYPMSSLASGMIALTRIRTEKPKIFVISSTQDHLSEVGIISITEGSALVFQPHSLIGILQRKDNPVRITSAWRFNSLHAWLTLQFRYLIFHGPVKLIVKGCRGIRVEKAGTGRSINQAATLGFSANLDYSTIRCGTFGAYLMGRDELFNDYFTGKSGFYVYEEMPNSGNKYATFGRGIPGITDSILKVFGI